jgi:hypothetical protein
MTLRRIEDGYAVRRKADAAAIRGGRAALNPAVRPKLAGYLLQLTVVRPKNRVFRRKLLIRRTPISRHHEHDQRSSIEINKPRRRRDQLRPCLF